MWKVTSSIKKNPTKHLRGLYGFLFPFSFLLFKEFGPGKASIEGFMASGIGFDF